MILASVIASLAALAGFLLAVVVGTGEGFPETDLGLMAVYTLLIGIPLASTVVGTVGTLTTWLLESVGIHNRLWIWYGLVGLLAGGLGTPMLWEWFWGLWTPGAAIPGAVAGTLAGVAFGAMMGLTEAAESE